MLIGKIDAAIASARLWVLLLKMRDPAPFYKLRGTIVLNQARANARAKGGRTLWKQIADSVRLKRVFQLGAELECTGLRGRIGLHKQNNITHFQITSNHNSSGGAPHQPQFS